MKHLFSSPSGVDRLRDQYKNVARKCGIQVSSENQTPSSTNIINLQYLNGECWATDSDDNAFELSGQIKCSLFLFMQMLDFKTGKFEFNQNQDVLSLESFKVNSQIISFVEKTVSVIDLSIASELSLARI